MNGIRDFFRKHSEHRFRLREHFLGHFSRCLVSLVLVFALCFCPFLSDFSFSFLVDSFADSSNGVSFSSSLLPALSMTQSNYRTGFLIYANASNSIYIYSSSELENSVYVFLHSVGGSSGYLTFVSSVPDSTFYVGNSQTATSWHPRIETFSCSRSSDYGVYYYEYFYNNSSAITSIPVYSDLDSGLSDFSSFIDSSEDLGDYLTSTRLFSVPTNYVAYIPLDTSKSDFDISVTTSFDENSSFLFGSWTPKTATWGFTDTLPSGSASFDNSGLLDIPFYKTGDLSFLGQSKEGYTNKATMVANGFWNESPSGKYLVIYNPLIRYVENNGKPVYNHDISVTVSGFYDSVKLYSLSTTGSFTGGFSESPSNGSWEDTQGSVTFGDSESGTYTSPDGSESSAPPPSGGSNSMPSSNVIESITGYLNNISTTLSNFANSFISLLKAPISHVQQLISAGSDYFSVIRGLYAWLPDSVQNTLESAMIVSISIGVIGLLL